jgi:hypothetical protein
MADYDLYKQHVRIAEIGRMIAASKPLSDVDKAFMSDALIAIGRNVDPKEALGIKVTRGGTPLSKQKVLYARDQLALTWLAAAKTSKEEEGLGLTLDEAIDLFASAGGAEMFGFNEDTLRKYWNNRPDDRGLETKYSPTD